MLNNFDRMQPKQSLSHEMFPSYSKDSRSDKTDDPGTSYEVFRNNTTAVEVIVKEVPNNGKNTADQKTTIKRLQGEIENLKQELKMSYSKLHSNNQVYKKLVYEMKKQLDAANQRELERYTNNLAFQLENAKLRTLLDSKSIVVSKMKKEFVGMKRILKFVIKSLGNVPYIPEYSTFNTDPEYDDFEKGLKRDKRGKFSNLFDGAGTFDSSISKDLNSFEKY